MRHLIYSTIIFLFFSSFLTFSTSGFSARATKQIRIPEKKTYSVAAWAPYWDKRKIFNSFNKNKRLINEISPYWYYVLSNGKLRPTSKFDLRIVRKAKKLGIKVIPMISNGYNSPLISRIIRSRTLRRRHIRQLIRVAVKRKVDGVEIDYEGMNAKDRKKFSFFVKSLAQNLHKKKKILSVTVHAKTYEPGKSQQSKAQDWRVIGRYADRVRIMAYDYHWKTSAPGPIAPVRWVKRIAKLASKKIPKSKAIIGIGTYGYNWYGNKRAKAITLAQAKVLARRRKKRIRRDPKSKELYLRLKPGRAGIWIQDSGSLKYKLRIVKKYGLGGICFWRLGNEERKYWTVVKRELR